MNSNMILFDSHLHLNHPDFSGSEESVWNEARQAGIQKGVIIGYDLESSRQAIRLAEQFSSLYASVGISPHDIQTAPSDYLEQLEKMLIHPKVVAVGECGLEYHYPVGSHEMQMAQMAKQVSLARRFNKIVVLHLRDADEDFLQILETEPPAAAILHCFTASRSVMEKSVSLGYFISFSGILTFKNAHDLHDLAPLVPLDNLLVETDAPYLAPIPYRGKPCKPKMIRETVLKLADLRGMEMEILAKKTYQNACRAFGLSEGECGINS